MNRRILVTGANKGVGLAIVKALSANVRDTILLGTRNLTKGAKIAAELPPNVHAVHLELDDPQLRAQQMSKIIETYGAIDVLINNAGVLHHGSILECSEENMNETIEVNLMAAYHLTKCVLPHMIHQNYGRIVNVSSGWGAFSLELNGPFSYCLSKVALNGLTVTSSQNLPSNVKVNSMTPGWTNTDMGRQASNKSLPPRTPEEGADTAVWLANISEQGPNGGFFFDRKPHDW